MSILEHQQEVDAWRQARLQRLTARDGWLSLIGKVPLEPGTLRVGSAPGCEVQLPAERGPAQLGTLELRDGGVRFEPHPDAARNGGVLRAGSLHATPLDGAIELKTDASGTPDRVVSGELSIEVMQRGDVFAVRVRDASSPTRLRFPGLSYYPIDPAWRITARLERYRPERKIGLLYETGMEEAYIAPGAAVFEVEGREYRIDPVIDGNNKRLFLIFSDATSRAETYGAGRFLYAPWPVGDEVLLDFNLAFNPPCAFTPYAVCPLPPPQNRLPFRIHAGEKRPLDSGATRH